MWLATQHGDEFAIVELMIVAPQIAHLQHLPEQGDEWRSDRDRPPRKNFDLKCELPAAVRIASIMSQPVASWIPAK